MILGYIAQLPPFEPSYTYQRQPIRRPNHQDPGLPAYPIIPISCDSLFRRAVLAWDNYRRNRRPLCRFHLDVGVLSDMRY